MPRLENWSVLVDHDGPNRYLKGVVSGHPRLPDGAEIRSTSIQGRRETRIVTLSGSEYELGTPDPQYLRFFPNALSHVLEGLPEMLKPTGLARQA